MQDKPQDWNSRNTNQYWTRSLGSIIDNHHDHSGRQIKFCNQHLSKNSKKSPKLRKFGEMPHQFILRSREIRLIDVYSGCRNNCCISSPGPMIPGYTIRFLRNRGLKSVFPSRAGQRTLLAGPGSPGILRFLRRLATLTTAVFFHCIRNWLGMKRIGQKKWEAPAVGLDVRLICAAVYRRRRCG